MVLIDSELSPIYGIIRENDTKRVTKEPFETGKAKEVGWQFFSRLDATLDARLMWVECVGPILCYERFFLGYFSGTSGFDYFK